jgi:hypothetical protein
MSERISSVNERSRRVNERSRRFATKFQRLAEEEARAARHYRDAEDWNEAAILYQEKSAHSYRLSRRHRERVRLEDGSR